MKRRTVVLGLLVLVLAIPAGAIWLAVSQGENAAGPSDLAGARGEPDAPDSAAASAAAGHPFSSDAGGRPGHAPRDGAGTVVGRLLERGSERPVADAPVALVPRRAGGRKSHSARTADDGGFEFRGVPAFGTWVLAVEEHTHLHARATRIEVRADSETDIGIVYVEPRRTVEGIVVTEQGRPIGGALVRAVARGPGTMGADLQQAIRQLPEAPAIVDSAETSDDGTFVLTRVPPGSCDLAASAAGHGLAVIREVIVPPKGEGARVRLVLPEGTQLLGRVVHRLGGNVAGLRVTAFAEESTSDDLLLLDKVLALTDAEGWFHVDGLAPIAHGKGHVVCVTQENGVRTLRENVDVSVTEPVEIAIGGATSLEGTVTAQDGRPVDGAEFILNLRPERNSMVLAVTQSGADGSYRLTDLPVGRVDGYLVTAEGYSPYPGHSAALTHQERATQLTITAGRNVLDVQLDGSAKIRGVVLERGTEHPLAGVRVSLLSSRGWFGHAPSVLTDAAGRFTIAGTSSSSAKLILWKEGWTTSSSDRGQPAGSGAERVAEGARPGGEPVVATAIGQEIEHTLMMERSARVHGRVLSPDGDPISGAVVTLHPAGAVNGPDRGVALVRGLPERTTTDARGRFELPGAGSEGQNAVHATAEGYLPARTAPLSAVAGQGLADVEIRLRQGVILEVVVTGPDGAFIEGATVTWTPNPDPEKPRRVLRRGRETRRTGVNGSCRAENLDTGKLSVSVAHPQYLRVDRDDLPVVEGQTVRLAITLERGGRIEGIVLGADGAPFPGASVHTKPVARDGPTTCRTDEFGRFELRELRDGSYRLHARAAGTAGSDEVSAIVGGPSATLRLRPESPISGTVRFPDGTPAAGARITARATEPRESRRVSASVLVAADGAFRIPGLLAGRYVLDIDQGHTSQRPNLLPITLRDVAAGSSGLAIRAEFGETIAGHVFLPDRRPAPKGEARGVCVDSGDADAPLHGRSVTAPIDNGAFELTGLRAGLVRVTVRVGGQQLTLDVPSGLADLRIDLPEVGVISGRVLLPDGRPAVRARVRATGSGETPDVATDQSGRFSLRGVSVGTYTVRAVLHHDRRSHEASCTAVIVTPNGNTTVSDLTLEPQTE